MLYSQEETLLELESTLDQLLIGATMLGEKHPRLSETERDLLNKTHESLREHFLHAWSASKKRLRRKSLEVKIAKLRSIDPCFGERLANPSHQERPRIGRNRKASRNPLECGEFAYAHF